MQGRGSFLTGSVSLSHQGCAKKGAINDLVSSSYNSGRKVTNCPTSSIRDTVEDRHPAERRRKRLAQHVTGSTN